MRIPCAILSATLLAGCGWVEVESTKSYPAAGTRSVAASTTAGDRLSEPSYQPRGTVSAAPRREPIERSQLAPPSSVAPIQSAAPVRDVPTVRSSTGSGYQPRPTAIPSTSPPVASASGGYASAGGTVTVEQGDTVYAISRRTGVPPRAIIDQNGLPPPYVLHPGQRLTLPAPSAGASGYSPPSVASAPSVPATRTAAAPVRDLTQPRPRPGNVGGGSAAREENDSVSIGAARPVVEAPPTAPAASEPVTAPKVASTTDAPTAISTEPPPRSGEGFLTPVEGRVVRGFGPDAGGVHNDGINIAAPRGAPVRAADDGVVVYAGDGIQGFGKLVLVKHEGGWTTAYAHNQEILVKPGTIVRRGETIATVGTTGSVQEPQVHFELRRANRAVNPAPFVFGRSG